jgi:hemoglobin
MHLRNIVIAAFAALSLAACGGGSKKPDTMTNTGGATAGSDTAAATEKSLYDRLGGQDAIKAVVKDFVEENVIKDKRINAFFANADAAHLEQMLSDQICSATGGPCKYTGKNMKEAHAGMPIKEADFNALVEDLAKSLDKFKVGEKEKTDLLGALGTMKGDIVAK